MNLNTILIRLGINPDNFAVQEQEPIRISDGFIYEVTQKSGERKCPCCGDTDVHIHGHYYTEIDCSETDQIKDILLKL